MPSWMTVTFTPGGTYDASIDYGATAGPLVEAGHTYAYTATGFVDFGGDYPVDADGRNTQGQPYGISNNFLAPQLLQPDRQGNAAKQPARLRLARRTGQLCLHGR